jgi:signal transduction histidine kinase
MFASLALAILAQEFTSLTGQTFRWLSLLGSMATIAQPYLLLRLVEHFRPVRPVVRWGSFAGLIGSWALELIFPSPLPIPATLFIIVYFVFVEAYAAVAFIRGAVDAGGVTRWRMALAAIGSGLLAVVILIAGIDVLVPALAPIMGPVIQLLVILSPISYYLGFAPPRWLRQSWQFAELYRFLRETASQPAAERANHTLQHLCEAAMRAVGGRGALAALREADGDQLSIHASCGALPASGSLVLKENVIQQSVQPHQPAVTRPPAEYGSAIEKLSADVGADTLLTAPIGTAEQLRGVLLVFRRGGPLFESSDLDLLVLLAEQSAIALDYSELLIEQREMVEQLRQRTAALESANAELEAFSYSVSHDLRAPLRAMDGFALMLLEDFAPQLNDRAQLYIQKVRDNAQYMGQLVDDLLDFSRLSRQKLQKRGVRLNSLVREAWDSLHIEQEGREVKITLGDLPTCEADPALLKQVFVNLLSNSLKFTRERPEALIEIGSRTKGGEQIYFVKDNGVGFDMHYADKLFRVFERLHHSEEYEGTGVGLAIVQRVVQRHGGRIWAESEVDKGTTFYFTLGSG